MERLVSTLTEIMSKKFEFQVPFFNEKLVIRCMCTDMWKGKNCNHKTIDCLTVPQFEICGHGLCVPSKNNLGYSCICEEGWRKSNETGSCTVDINECVEMKPHCSIEPPVLCVNTPGSFVCGNCPAGFSGNGFYCADIDECEINNGGCSSSPKVECINTKVSSFNLIKKSFSCIDFRLKRDQIDVEIVHLGTKVTANCVFSLRSH